jgi:hypothetical protein
METTKILAELPRDLWCDLEVKVRCPLAAGGEVLRWKDEASVTLRGPPLTGTEINPRINYQT